MNFNDYENKLEYPKKPIKKCMNCNWHFNDGYNYCSACGHSLKFYSELLKEYKIKLEDYNNNSCVLYEKFRYDSLNDVDLLDHPKANKIFSIAWEYGHSSGLHDVYYWLKELSELFMD